MMIRYKGQLYKRVDSASRAIRYRGETYERVDGLFDFFKKGVGNAKSTLNAIRKDGAEKLKRAQKLANITRVADKALNEIEKLSNELASVIKQRDAEYDRVMTKSNKAGDLVTKCKYDLEEEKELGEKADKRFIQQKEKELADLTRKWEATWDELDKVHTMDNRIKDIESKIESAKAEVIRALA